VVENKVDGTSDIASGTRGRFRWWLKHILIAAVLIVIASFFLIPAYHGYRPRALINEAVQEGMPLRTSVAVFYEQHRRLPRDDEAKAFQLPPSKLNRAQSVTWNSANRNIVITMRDPHPGKRFAFYAEERDDVLNWGCRTIDLDSKYLPGSCR